MTAVSFHIDPLSQAESLSVLTPAQLAQYTQSTRALNDTDQMDRVFEQLEKDNAFENVDVFLTELTADEKVDNSDSRERKRILGFFEKHIQSLEVLTSV